MAAVYRRFLLPAFLCISLTLIIVVFSRNTQSLSANVGRFKSLYESKQSEAISDSSHTEASYHESKAMDPLFDRTYEKILSDSGERLIAKDPCIDLIIPNGGDKVEEVSKTRVLVTGGAGFIGSNLVDRLLHLGYKVRILDNLYTGFLRNVPIDDPNVELIVGDILDQKVLEKAVDGVEYVYHLAAMSKVVPSTRNSDMARFCTETNALGSWNILEAVRKAGGVKKVIYAASSTYYGNQPAPHREDMAPDFLTPYAASKYEGEIQMQMFDSLFGVKTISTRFFMVYGPRQPSTGAYAIVTGVFSKQAAEGKPLTIEGDGSHYRDFIHVSDIVDGLILAQQNDDVHGEVVNLGSGTAYSVKDVADLISSSQKHVAERPNDLEGTLANTCKMRRLLNYKTKKDFKTEMGFMAKETMAGNVFAQKWLSYLHALSSPYLLPSGSPMLGWPKESDDLDALLLSLKRLEPYVNPGGKTAPITILFLSTVDPENTDYEDVLLNTIFSLVRYGQVRSYFVAASDWAARESCHNLNLPCYDATETTPMGVLSHLVSVGHDAHIAQIGNSYSQSVAEFFSKSKASNADVIGIKPFGDVFITSNDNTKSAFEKLASESTLSTPNLYDLDKWPSTDMSSSTVYIQRKCDSFTALACSKDLYMGVGCTNSVLDANSTIIALKESSAWHLADCHDPIHCDRQQKVPKKWIAEKADLSMDGTLC